MIRIVLADDHTMVRNALGMLLNHQPDMEVVAVASGSDDAYETVKEYEPDIVMLDISMPPGDSGVVAAGKIHMDFPKVRIIMLTMHADKDYLLYSVQIGVSG